MTGRIGTELASDFPQLADHADALVLENGAVAVIDGQARPLVAPVDSALDGELAAHDIAFRRGQVARLAVRATRDTLASPHLEAVNEKMAELPGLLDDKPIELAMDQTSRGAWDSSVIPHVAQVPFLLSGQGQQAAIKIALAMGRTTSAARVVMIEEPENHLSHTNLGKLLARVADLAGDEVASHERCKSGLTEVPLACGHDFMRWRWNRLAPRRFRYGLSSFVAAVGSAGRAVRGAGRPAAAARPASW